MRTALCISGYLRTFGKTFPSFKQHVIDPLQCDVFVSTWDRLGTTIGYLMSDEAAPADMERAKDLYRPVKFEVENWPLYLARIGDLSAFEKGRRPDVSIPNIIGMWYKIWRANELKREHEQQEGFTYDLVIRSRPDILFYEPLDLRRLPNVPDDVCIGNRFGFGGLPDQLAYGKSTTMDVYCSLINHIYRYFTEGCTFQPEILLAYHLRHNGIKYIIGENGWQLLRS